MLFSVVIPTCARYGYLAMCLDGLELAAQQVPGSDLEVIVSDDTPEDERRADPAPGLAFVKAVPGPRRGPASNRNRGASIAKGDWLIFVDDDCVPQPGFLKGYGDALSAHPECRVFEGRTAANRPKARMDEEAPITDAGGFLWSCNFAIRRDVFERLGGFCEDFPYAAMEDVDFRLRIVAAGEKFLYVPAAQVMHPWRPVSVAAKAGAVPSRFQPHLLRALSGTPAHVLRPAPHHRARLLEPAHAGRAALRLSRPADAGSAAASCSPWRNCSSRSTA